MLSVTNDDIFQQGGSPKGHKSISKENVAQSGEAVFVPCQTPQHGSRPSTSATSSNFQVSSSSYESSASGTGEYRKVPKFSEARKLHCNLPKLPTKRTNLRVFCRKGACGIANSEDPNQTAPLGAV